MIARRSGVLPSLNCPLHFLLQGPLEQRPLRHHPDIWSVSEPSSQQVLTCLLLYKSVFSSQMPRVFVAILTPFCLPRTCSFANNPRLRGPGQQQDDDGC
jgi:hypothetical protein